MSPLVADLEVGQGDPRIGGPAWVRDSERRAVLAGDLDQLRKRGLSRVRLVASDPDTGPVATLGGPAVMGRSWVRKETLSATSTYLSTKDCWTLWSFLGT